MKNRVFAFFVAVFIATFSAYADVVTAEQAMLAAESWAVENGGVFGSSSSAVGVVTEKDSTGKVLWYGVKMSDGGCIFTTGDSRIGPILASVSKCDGNVPQGHPLRALLSADIKSRFACLDYVDEQNAKRLMSFANTSSATSASVAAISKSISNASTKWARFTDGAVGNKLKAFAGMETVKNNPPTIIGYVRGFANNMFTHWNQGASAYSKDYGLGIESGFLLPVYNFYTPHNWVCGCVATAGAAILQTYNVTEGPGIRTNMCSVGSITSVSNMVTKGGVYNWDILPNTMGGNITNVTARFSLEQRELLGRVTYDFGVLIGAYYAPMATGADMNMFGETLEHYYGFASARVTPVPAPGASAAEREATYDPFIYSYLKANMPVPMGIRDPTGAGHAVIAVGYGKDSSNSSLTRIFMGWGGSGDAWYSLPEIDIYNVIDCVIVQISRDENCVPITGQVKMADGTPASFATVTIDALPEPITAGANGWFSAIVPTTVASVNVTAKLGTAEASAVVEYGGGVEGPASAEIVLGEDAINNIPFYASPDAAAEAALAQGKSLVLFSGFNTEEKTEFIKKLLAENAEEFNKNCILYYADAATDSYGYIDAVPSVGFFAPQLFKPADSWKVVNGRMSYRNFTQIPLDQIESEYDVIFQKGAELLKDVEHFTQALKDKNKVAISGIVRAAEFYNLEYLLGFKEIEDGTPEVGFGVYENAFTNNESVVMASPQVFTNTTVWKCVGWYVFDNKCVPSNDDKDLWAEEGIVTNTAWAIAQGTSTVAEFTMPADGECNLTLAWRYTPNRYKVSVDVNGGYVVSSGGLEYDNDTQKWTGYFNYGEEVTVVTTPKTSNGYAFLFKQWDGDNSEDQVRGQKIKIKVNGTRELSAYYEYPQGYTFTSYDLTVGAVSETPLPAGDVLPATKYGDSKVLALGETIQMLNAPSAVAPLATSYTDATGGVWKCVGWTNGVGNVSATGKDPFVTFTLDANTKFDWLWKLDESKFEIVTNLAWDMSLANLSTTNEFVLAKAPIPADFNLDDFELAIPTGWVAKASVDALTGDIVAKLSLNTNALIPRAVAGEPSVISIKSNSDGTMTLSVGVENGLRGFWYCVYGATDLGGPYNLIQAVQADLDQDVMEVVYDININPAQDNQFFKLVVTEFPEMTLP